MQINLIQAFLIGLVYYLGINGTPWLTMLGSTSLMRPMVCGTLVGLILGDPVAGCTIGAAINLPYIAWNAAGGAQSVDQGLAGTLGTTFALASGISASAAMTMAIAIGLLGNVIWILHLTVDIIFAHMADDAAEKGDIHKIGVWYNMILPQGFLFLISVIPVILIVFFGTDAISGLLTSLPEGLLHALEMIGGVLPVLGIAMNLRAINTKTVLVFFLLGYLISIYSGISIVAISLFAAIIAFLYMQLTVKEKGEDNV